MAHLFRAGDSAEMRIGSLLGDFLQGVDRSRYSGEIQQGIRLHHAVDRFTDSHELFARSRNRLRPPYRRYAGVLVDIFYDHFLATHWAAYSREPLTAFSQTVYAALTASEEVLPQRLRRMLPHMAAEDWLSSYRTCQGIDRTLKRLARRLKRENPLPTAICQLEEHYGGLEEDFLEFFPALMEFASRQRDS